MGKEVYCCILLIFCELENFHHIMFVCLSVSLKVILSLERSFPELCPRMTPIQEAGISRGNWT